MNIVNGTDAIQLFLFNLLTITIATVAQEGHLSITTLDHVITHEEKNKQHEEGKE